MFNIETTDAIGAERYVDVDWKGIGAIDGHPLDFLIARGISVYYKVHRGDFFVSRHQWQPVVPGSAKEIAGLSIKRWTTPSFGATLICCCCAWMRKICARSEPPAREE